MKTRRPKEQHKLNCFLKKIANDTSISSRESGCATNFNFKHMGDLLIAFSDNTYIGRDDSVYLLLISVEEEVRGRGVGKQLMEFLITAADLYQVKLALTVMEVEQGMSVRRLKKFYKNFGFVSTEEDEMIRNPVNRFNCW